MVVSIEIPRAVVVHLVKAHVEYLTGVTDNEHIMNQEIDEWLHSQVDTSAQIKFEILDKLHIPEERS